MVLGNGRNTRMGGPMPKLPTPTNRSSRTSTGNPNSSATLDELLDSDDYSVTSADDGIKYLEKHLICQVGHPFSIEHLAHALAQISQLSKVPRPAVEAIRAVIYILRDHAASETATAVVEHVKASIATEVAAQVITAISPHIGKMMQTAENLESNTKDLERTRLDIVNSAPTPIPSIESTIERVEEAADAVYSSIGDVKNAIELLAPSLFATQECINVLCSGNVHPHDDSNNTQRPSYSSVVKANPGPTQHTTVDTTVNNPVALPALARAAVRERQILLQPIGDQPIFETDTPTSTIATKIQEVLDSLQPPYGIIPKIVAVLRLRGGGVTLEMNDSSSADWIREPDIRTKLIDQLGVQAVVKDRQHQILVPFIPIRYDVKSRDWLDELEAENNLPSGALDSVRWVKPIEKRSPNQRVAHAVFSFNIADAANNILRDGLLVGKERLHPWKERREPIRCAKCQLWGHIARVCKSLHDVCASCGHLHKTEHCSKSEGTFCVSCNDEGHASNDQRCPTFIAKCDELNAKHPENLMPYFPTHEPWTQVTLPPKRLTRRESPPPATTQMQPPNAAALRQSTRPFWLILYLTFLGTSPSRMCDGEIE